MRKYNRQTVIGATQAPALQDNDPAISTTCSIGSKPIETGKLYECRFRVLKRDGIGGEMKTAVLLAAESSRGELLMCLRKGVSTQPFGGFPLDIFNSAVPV